MLELWRKRMHLELSEVISCENFPFNTQLHVGGPQMALQCFQRAVQQLHQKCRERKLPAAICNLNAFYQERWPINRIIN